MNKEEYENAVNRRLDMVVRLAYTYLKSFAEAEDAAQEVFLRLFKEDISFDSAEAEKAWLIRVTANYCINRRRLAWFSRRDHRDIADVISTDIVSTDVISADIASDIGTDEFACVEMSGSEQAVLEAVMSLPLKYRTVIHLYYYEEYSVKEISQLTGVKESTVRTRLQRGRERLRAALGKEYGDECTAL